VAFVSGLATCSAPHPARTCGIGEVAELVGVHPVHLTRSFRALTACPSSHISETCVWSRRPHALADSTSTIADIAAPASFYEQGHFTRMFKRRYGLTPHDYQRAAR
jgi:AraC family transcriptional regulator